MRWKDDPTYPRQYIDTDVGRVFKTTSEHNVLLRTYVEGIGFGVSFPIRPGRRLFEEIALKNLVRDIALYFAKKSIEDLSKPKKEVISVNLSPLNPGSTDPHKRVG